MSLKKVLFLSMMMVGAESYARELNVCLNPRFTKEPILQSYVELITLVAQRAGHTITGVPMNWEDCQEMVKQGQFDGAMPAIWNDKRAEYMYMPSDAGTNLDTPYALAKLDYAVVTPLTAKYKFNGDIKTVPQPILVPEGYVLAKEIAKIDPSLQIKVIGADDYDNFVRLTRGEPGSVIALEQYAQKTIERKVIRGKLSVSHKPVFAKTFFMAFSKKNVPQEEVMKMWKLIPEVKKSAEWIKIHKKAVAAAEND